LQQTFPKAIYVLELRKPAKVPGAAYVRPRFIAFGKEIAGSRYQTERHIGV
jgi:hypothetical protein